jgi:D-3-phosphoglycerate dehydrogenase
VEEPRNLNGREFAVATIFLTHSPDMLKNYYGDRAVAAMRELGEVRINSTGKVLDAATLVSEARGSDIVVSDRQTAAPGEALRQLDCAAFLRGAVDIRNIDVETASAQGILVTRATPGFIASVAELGVGMMIDLARGITRATNGYRAGAQPEARPGLQLKGATVGIVGYGVIGEYLARLCLGFGMTVLASDPYKTIVDAGVKQVSFEDLLASSDFVMCLVVATDQTENLIDAKAFARMKPTAYFINLSRGNLVDDRALIAALDNRRIAGAATDVGRAPDQMPTIEIGRRSDVIATPHIGGLTPQAIEHQAFDTVNQVAELVAGRVPPGAVNAERATRLSRLRRS